MKIKKLHNWNISYRDARQLQKTLAARVKFSAMRKQPVVFAGVDCALSRDRQKIIACVVALKMVKGQFELLETRSAAQKVPIPYIPGLLSFREAPACIAAVEKLTSSVDVFIIDGQGIAHPRRLGLAAHLGLFFDRPTIGCAKSRLIGTFEQPDLIKGNFTDLKDRGETIGSVVRTRDNVKPVYVSVGHKCLLKDAVRIVLDCAIKYRLPEPTRMAHSMVSKAKLKY